MPKFRIACKWEMKGIMNVNAKTLEEAKTIAVNNELIPKGSYIDHSFTIRNRVTNMYLEEDEDA